MPDRCQTMDCHPGHDGVVLVVEDDPEINELVGAYVQLAGFEYRRALNGFEALHQARQWSPVLIVMDLMLPDLDGCEVCQRLKSDPATCDIPVVMLTAMDREAVRERCRQCGIIDFVCKPFNPDHLMAAMHRHAKRNGTASAMSARGAD